MVRLLFDQNLSRHLVVRLADIYPGSSHVALASLEKARDAEVYDHARAYGLAIVTKDADFVDLSLVRGFPPKVIWLRMGNCTTRDIERVLRANLANLVAFGGDPENGILTLI